MHQFVNLWKVHETNDAVEYAYGIERESSGLIMLNKENGRVKILRSAIDFYAGEDHQDLIALTEQKLGDMDIQKNYPDSLYFA